MTNLLISKRNLRLYDFSNITGIRLPRYNSAPTLTNYGTLRKLFSIQYWVGGEVEIQTQQSLPLHSFLFLSPWRWHFEHYYTMLPYSYNCTQENMHKQLIKMCDNVI